MCTVIVRVGDDPSEPVRLLAVRDEDPARSWDPLGAWWPERLPGVVGVRDRRAGGAWLAADPATKRLAVMLNRADVLEIPESELVSRGGLVLGSVAGEAPPERPRTHGFNLVEVQPGSAIVTSWDGTALRRQELPPGTHMIAHDDVDDATPRIAEWLGAFRVTDPDDSAGDPASLWRPWLDVLERSAALGPVDDRAIIRDNRPFGYPTLSLLVCLASVSADGVDVRYGAFDDPGTWNAIDLAAPIRPDVSGIAPPG